MANDKKRPMVVVIGGGWGGCSAALSASQAGANVILLERADMLLGTSLVGGILGANARTTAQEEIMAMGGDGMLKAARSCMLHDNVSIPNNDHVWMFDSYKFEGATRRTLEAAGVKVYLKSSVTKVNRKGDRIVAVVTMDGREFPGDVFVDATGTAGGPPNCIKHGNGCVMCCLRCHTFGPRVSVTAKAGIKERSAIRPDGRLGGMSGSAAVHKATVAPEVVAELERKGAMGIPLPPALRDPEHLELKVCQQYSADIFAEELWLVDNGTVKFITPYFPLDLLRQLKGFEEARYSDPYSGGEGNSIRFMALAPCEVTQRVEGIENLFSAGEKSGIFIGHTEAAVTGTLAGHNAVRLLLGMPLLALPTSTAIGDALVYVHEQMKTDAGLMKRYTFSGSVLFERVKAAGLYSSDPKALAARVAKAGFKDIFRGSLI